MGRELLIEKQGNEFRFATIEDDSLVDFSLERIDFGSIIGNVYLGRVERVIKGIGAAFIDLGLGRSGFLPFSNILDNDSRHNALVEGASVCVQVIRGEFREKGPQVSMEISLAGRFIVYEATSNRLAVSRQITNEAERGRLLSLVKQLRQDNEGFVLRTAAEGENFQTLEYEINYYRNCWNEILRKRDKENTPALIYEELDIVKKTIRDHAQDDVLKFHFDDNSIFVEAKEFCDAKYPSLTTKLHLNIESIALFEKYGVDEEIESVLKRDVPLPSGGALVIETTEALTAIDVNSGRYINGSDPEANASQINNEAATELCRQIRLRNLSGLIVVDFINMKTEKSWARILDKLRLEFSKDRVNCRVLGRTKGGVVELIRRRSRVPLKDALFVDCKECNGEGVVWRIETVIYEILKTLKKESVSDKTGRLVLNFSPEISDTIKRNNYEDEIFSRPGRQLVSRVVQDFAPDEYEIYIQEEEIK
ncbi:MAG: hypothetical protein CMM53_01560 [Rhodospirillaceae bacterium]|nr:hypothetical protein [Rhodospirillaceae bacterium]|tara:strand:- start:347 stop:1783 length:1437 start_codon:yes stop_codon:yes gene_type:complete